jgi:hypothetical protein
MLLEAHRVAPDRFSRPPVVSTAEPLCTLWLRTGGNSAIFPLAGCRGRKSMG